MKSLFTSKTFLLALVQAASLILAAAVTADPTLDTVAAIGVAKSVIDVLLRLFTTQAVYVK